ncbi:MAG: ribonuclease P protein component [Daejeonella sp.]
MYTFKKEERLCSKKLLDKLFHSGSSFLLYPFRITWLAENLAGLFPVQVVISVPKRRFKRAVDRNLLKRKIREIYRLNKSDLLYKQLGENNITLIAAIQFIGKDISDYAFLDKKLKLALEQLVKLSAAADEK